MAIAARSSAGQPPKSPTPAQGNLGCSRPGLATPARARDACPSSTSTVLSALRQPAIFFYWSASNSQADSLRGVPNLAAHQQASALAAGTNAAVLATILPEQAATSSYLEPIAARELAGDEARKPAVPHRPRCRPISVDAHYMKLVGPGAAAGTGYRRARATPATLLASYFTTD